MTAPAPGTEAEAAITLAGEWAERTGGHVTVFTAAGPVTAGQPVYPCGDTEIRPASGRGGIYGWALHAAAPGQLTAVQPATAGARPWNWESRFYEMEQGDPASPVRLGEYTGPHHGTIRAGDRVVYEKPEWKRANGTYATGGMNGTYTVTEIIAFGDGIPPNVLLDDGDYEVSADMLRAVPPEPAP